MVDITSTFHDILKNLSQQHHQNHEIQASTHHHSNHKNIASISPILVKCSELVRLIFWTYNCMMICINYLQYSCLCAVVGGTVCV